MKIFRNAPCICGSGKKYKKCCGSVDVVSGNKQENETEHFIKEEVPFSPDIPEFSEDFFNKLDTAQISAHKLIYSGILKPEIEAAAASLTNVMISRGKSEAELIKNCGTTSELIEMMKSGLDSLNHVLMRSRLLENPSEAVMSLLCELNKSTRDDFVELAVRIIAATENNISQELMTLIEKHEKTAYQISILCLLLGFYNNPKIPQFLWNYFCYFRSHFQNDNYWRGPFYGLWEYWASKKYG
jgi:hypothetical protein